MNGFVDVCSKVGEGLPYETRPVDQALCEMDGAGIERAWIHPTDACTAVRNREGNDFIARAVAAHPDRFIGCAVANPWWGAEALEELRRAVDLGLRALYLHPPVQGFQISAPLVDPLVEWATEHHVPIYAHTGTPVCAMPFQLAALARRHPNGRFIMGHMGYADFWYDAASAAGTSQNLWLETSLMSLDILRAAIEKLGVARFLLGTDEPFSSAVPEIEKVRLLGLSHDATHKILRDNAVRMLP